MATDIVYMFTLAVNNALREGISEGMQEALPAAVRALGESVEKSTVNSRGLFLQANERLARKMQDSVLRSYDQVVTARKPGQSYRVGSETRDAGGKLRTALADPSQFQASAEGIDFINADELDRQARQWYRLNYGSGRGGGGRSPVTAPVRFFGQTLFELNLDNPPGKAVRMPKVGSFGERGAPFFPGSKTLGRPTPNQIQARRFFDAGITRFAREFPVVYEDLLRTIVEDGIKGTGPLRNTRINVRAIF